MARTKEFIAVLALVGLVLAVAAAHAADGPQWPRGIDDGPQWPDASRRPVAYLAHRKPVAVIEGEFAARYWFSIGKTAKDLYDIAGNALVSRLTYDGLRGHSAEGFGRADHSSGWYVKGYLGGGIVTKGDLNDEDFAPFIVPYSSTMSNHKDGQMLYGSVDLGFNLVRNNAIRVGVFAGYHYFQEQVSAYGCTQVATNPLVCGGGGVPYSIRVITQDNTYHSLRVGLAADIRLSDRLSLRLDAAYLPHVILHGADFALAADRHLARGFHRSSPGRRQGPRLSARSRAELCGEQECVIRYRRALLASGNAGRHPFRGQRRRLRGVAAAGRVEKRYLRRVRAGLVQIRPLCRGCAVLSGAFLTRL